MVIACPGCGRTTSTYFQALAEQIQSYLRASMPAWRARYPGVENMHVAVMGCVVNGPGESKIANVGISLPGTGETPVAPVFVDGEKTVTLKGERIAEEFQALVDDYVRATYGGEEPGAAPQAGAQDDRRQGGRVGRHAMATALQAVRGMNDVLPDDAPLWERFEDTVRDVFRAVRLPQHPHADRRDDRALRARHRRGHRHRREGDVHVRGQAERRVADAAPGGDRAASCARRSSTT